MCVATTARFEACLDERGETWESAGYSSALDYRESCHTWAWELRVLARSPGAPEQAEENLDEFCAERQAVARDDTTTCEAFLALDWDTEPWLR
jgi:hypothetical protein